MKKLTRYVVTVKENGDTFHSFNIKEIYRWMFDYQESVLNQDIPWEPHFEETEEMIE